MAFNLISIVTNYSETNPDNYIYYELPEPSSYSAYTSTLVDSGRNVEGTYIGSVIRDSLAKVDISWNYLTAAQWATINQLFLKDENGNSRFVNKVRYFDQTVGDFVVKEMYVSDRTSGLWRRNPDTKAIMGFLDCKFSLIEV